MTPPGTRRCARRSTLHARDRHLRADRRGPARRCRGRLLLQLRDGNTRIDPHRWCLPGGHVDPGEDPQVAALRELHEETGLKPDSDLELFWTGISSSARFAGALAEYFIFCATTTARQQDVVCGEGAAMLFVPAGEAAGLPFGATYARVVPEFLASPQYRRLAGASATG
jgi:8-oxo-dGTP diphosphatase